MNQSPLNLDGPPLARVAAPAPESTPILLVDDEPGVRRVLGNLLGEKGYPVRESGAALDALNPLKHEPISLLLTDISMPGVNGIELAKRALSVDPDLAVIIITGVPDSVTAVESLRLGVSDYLAKPLKLDEVHEAVERTLGRRAEALYRRKLEAWLTAETERRARAVERVMVSTLATLMRAMEAKDPYLKGDSVQVAELSENLGRRLKLGADELESVRIAGLLHDIGLISVPESILHKSSTLTDEEYEQVKNHAKVGAEILRPLSHLGSVIDFVRLHHERLNGSGYPYGLKGDEIPLGARIVGLADSFVALIAERPFRRACSESEAARTLKASAGIWFDDHLLEALEQVVMNRARSAGSRSATHANPGTPLIT